MTTLAEYEESERELELEIQEREMINRSTEFEVSCHVIPHDKQRYPTAGDWQFYMGRLTLRVSEMSDPRYQQLVALHELVEALLCRWCGVTEQAVDEWDHDFSTQDFSRIAGMEPGDDPKAPYHKQHHIATITEMLAAELLGVDWNEYTKCLAALHT